MPSLIPSSTSGEQGVEAKSLVEAAHPVSTMEPAAGLTQMMYRPKCSRTRPKTLPEEDPVSVTKENAPVSPSLQPMQPAKHWQRKRM